MSDAWLTMTACDLGRAIGKGEVDPVDLTRTYLDAAQGHEFSGRIYARFTANRAMAEAQAASDRAKLGLRHSLLDGVPISWKDLFDTAGTATEAGSALLKDRVPDTDAEVLRNASEAGLVCLGKVHMSELAFSGLGLNPITETPPCVNDHDAVPGGSSSGSGTSVAFGLAAASIGSDTGGSVRIPSAWNDLVGLKTTIGGLPVAGSVPLCARFDTIGPLCRSVEDAAHLLAAMEGSTPADLRGLEASNLNLAVLDTVAFDDIRDAPAAGFNDKLRLLTDAGAKVTHVKIPEVEQALALSGVLFATEAYAQWQTEIEANPQLMFPEILNRFRSGKDTLAKDFLAAWAELERLTAIWAAKTAQFDAVMLPTSPILPPNLERLMTDSDYYVTENQLALRNTRIGNLFGLCGLSLPTGTPSAGFMLLGAPNTEEKLLRIGAVVERV